MRNILFLLVAAVLSAFSTATTGDVKELTGYKLATPHISYTDYNLWVVTTRGTFCENFSPMNNTVPYPDFDNEWILAGKVKTLQHAYYLEFKKTSAEEDHLDVYFKIKKDRAAQETDESVSMIAFPRDAMIKRVNFYHDKVLVKTIPIVTVF